MVYHHLKKLERLGWVSAVPEVGTGKTGAAAICIVFIGTGRARRWLSEPVARTREIRLDFLVKLYLALLLDPTLAVRLVDEQRERCARLVESLANRLRSGHSRGGAGRRSRQDLVTWCSICGWRRPGLLSHGSTASVAKRPRRSSAPMPDGGGSGRRCVSGSRDARR